MVNSPVPDMSWCAWTPSQMRKNAEAAVAQKRQALERVKAVIGPERTFENTVAAMERAGDPFDAVHQRLHVLAEAHPDATIRDAAHAVLNEMDDADIELTYDRLLWEAFCQWEERGESLEPVDVKLASDMRRDMRRTGFGLSDTDFARLKAVTAELERLQKDFEKAINDWEDGIDVTDSQLDGLPESYKDHLSRTNDGSYRVTLDYPDLFPFLRYAHDDSARRTLAHKQLKVGGQENLLRLARMIDLRQERASLLGYATHADFACEDRMARSGQAVRAFLEGIIGDLIPAAHRELRDLIDIKQRVLGLEQRKPILFHEFSYFSNRLLQERYALDAEEVKQYFPLERVMDGMFSIFGGLFGLSFSRIGVQAWHPDVMTYAVSDGESSELMGHLCFDLFPRTGKYGHAMTAEISLGTLNADGTRTLGILSLLCNFPSPTAATPSLLTHSEVETLLHEFGHALHAIVSAVRWRSQNGFGVALDFVEAPSQIMEEWAWDRRSLDKLSGHVRTGKPIPDELLHRMLGARNHMQAHYHLNLAVKALFDLAVHSVTGQRKTDPERLAMLFNEMQLRTRAMELPDDAVFPAGWSHMADYDAGYYSYLWSKVYALDLFSRFIADPLSSDVGRAYRKAILEPGNSEPEMDLVIRFLGREPSRAAFTERIATAVGIATT